MKETILLIDDNVTDSRELTKELKTNGFNVIYCDNGEAGIEALENNKISLILLDMIMPEMDGLTFLNDYVVKPCYIGFLIKKIRCVLEEKIKITELNNKLWIYENIKVNFSTRQVLWNDNEVSLGKTRLEILKLLINNKGIVLSREQIINYIWGTHCKINDRTVDSHISKIRTALDLNCLKSIPGYGYILDC